MTRFLITSALPYVNGVKHLGNLAGSLLPADVHARFRRQIGDDVLFICGTDEHGTPAELGAIQAEQDVRTFCDQQHAIQADIYRRFGLSFDHFGRSSSLQNHALTQHFYRRLVAAGPAVSAGPICAWDLSPLWLRRGAGRSMRRLRQPDRSHATDPPSIGAV